MTDTPDEPLALLLSLAAEAGIAPPDEVIAAAVDGRLPPAAQLLLEQTCADAIRRRRQRDAALLERLRAPRRADSARLPPRDVPAAPRRWQGLRPAPRRVAERVLRLGAMGSPVEAPLPITSELFVPLDDVSPDALLLVVRITREGDAVIVPPPGRPWAPVRAFRASGRVGLLLSAHGPPGPQRYVFACLPPDHPLATKPPAEAELEAALSAGELGATEVRLVVADDASELG